MIERSVLLEQMTAYEIQVLSSITKSIASTGSTDIVNVTEVGILLAIAFQGSVNLTGTPTVTLDITIGGGTKRSIKMYTASNSWDADFKAMAAKDPNDGGAQAADGG